MIYSWSYSRRKEIRVLQNSLLIYPQFMNTIYGSGDRGRFGFPPVLPRALRLPLSYLFSLIAICALLLSGCAGFKTDNQQEFNLMVSTRSPLYKTGPNQTTPDTYLEQGTRLRMLRVEGDSALVETTYGLQGYIAQSSIQAAGQEPPRNQY